MDDEALRKEILSRFPKNTILKIRLRRHTDAPEIEPGTLQVSLVPRGPEEYNADWRKAPQEVAHEVVYGFLHAHEPAFERLRQDLPGLMSERVALQGVGYGHQGYGTNVDERPPDEGAPASNDVRLRQMLLSRFPATSLLCVELLRHHDRLEYIEPGALKVWLVPTGPEEYNAKRGESVPPDVARHVVHEFHHAHDGAFQQLEKDLPGLMPERFSSLGIKYGSYSFGLGWGTRPAAERGLTAVMARLNQTDLETLDTLIAAGLVNSRAGGIRWCLARIRERPAFQELQQRVRDIGRLKAEF